MTINTERLGVLLDRAADVEAAARQARADLAEAENALRQHSGDASTRNALVARVDRRRAAHEVLSRRGSVWISYRNELRALAAKNGVTL